jgi:hypothetical protein
MFASSLVYFQHLHIKTKQKIIEDTLVPFRMDNLSNSLLMYFKGLNILVGKNALNIIKYFESATKEHKKEDNKKME